MICIDDISFDFGGPAILAGFSCSFNGQWPVAIMGTSGCGKSTLLRLIAGLERPCAGAIRVERALRSPNGNSRVFYAFQDFDAFPWLTVEENVRFVLSHSGRAPASMCRGILADVGLRGHERKYPRELSGGMRKRLSLARAMASGADVYLLDEPFASLDVCAREGMYGLLMRMCSERHILPILVTHAIEEAVFLAARVLVCDGPPLKIAHDIPIDTPYPRAVNGRGEHSFETAYIAVQRAFRELRAD